ncbi:MAG: sulfite exporter TauE/SafE family protein [Methanobacterium sp.]
MNELVLLFFIIAFLSVVLGTVVGFGTSTVFLPLALFFVDFKTALVLVAITHISGSLGATTFFRHGLDRKLILLFGVPTVILTVIGAYLVIYVPQDVLQITLGIFLFLFSIYSLLKSDFKISATKINTIIGGGLSGFMQGLIGIGGPLRGAFLNSYNLKKFKYIATLSAIAIIEDATRIPIYFSNNLLEPQFYYYIPFLVVIGIAGSYTGRKIVNRIPQNIFKKVVLVVIAIVSLVLVYGGVNLFIR